jgi:hypothetical protein
MGLVGAQFGQQIADTGGGEVGGMGKEVAFLAAMQSLLQFPHFLRRPQRNAAGRIGLHNQQTDFVRTHGWGQTPFYSLAE